MFRFFVKMVSDATPSSSGLRGFLFVLLAALAIGCVLLFGGDPEEVAPEVIELLAEELLE